MWPGTLILQVLWDPVFHTAEFDLKVFYVEAVIGFVCHYTTKYIN